MDTERQPQLTPGGTALAQCKTYALSQQSFLLQGGAGSGKTELLKELLLFLSKAAPESRVICITHTNAAVNEIRSRTGDVYPVLRSMRSYTNLLRITKRTYTPSSQSCFISHSWSKYQRQGIFRKLIVRNPSTKTIRRFLNSMRNDCMPWIAQR